MYVKQSGFGTKTLGLQTSQQRIFCLLIWHKMSLFLQFVHFYFYLEHYLKSCWRVRFAPITFWVRIWISEPSCEDFCTLKNQSSGNFGDFIGSCDLSGPLISVMWLISECVKGHAECILNKCLKAWCCQIWFHLNKFNEILHSNCTFYVVLLKQFCEKFVLFFIFGVIYVQYFFRTPANHNLVKHKNS